LRRAQPRASDLAHGEVFLAARGVDFQKRTSIIAVSRKGAQKLGRLAMPLAQGEGFQAHARSAEFRLEKTPRGKP